MKRGRRQVSKETHLGQKVNDLLLKVRTCRLDLAVASDEELSLEVPPRFSGPSLFVEERPGLASVGPYNVANVHDGALKLLRRCKVKNLAVRGKFLASKLGARKENDLKTLGNVL